MCAFAKFLANRCGMNHAQRLSPCTTRRRLRGTAPRDRPRWNSPAVQFTSHPPTTSAGCSPPTRSTTACRCASMLRFWASSTSTPPAVTPRCFPSTLSSPISTSIERRRQLRPSEEAKVADHDEWTVFEEKAFPATPRRLGECHRPYGTPCVHAVRVTNEMTENAEERLVEANESILGEAAALEEGLRHLRLRQAEAHGQKIQGANPFRQSEMNTRA